MKRDELKDLIKESIREVLKEDNIIKALFSESLETSLKLIKENVSYGSKNLKESDTMRENLLFTKKQMAPKRVIPEEKKQKLDPLLMTMLDQVEMIKD